MPRGRRERRGTRAPQDVELPHGMSQTILRKSIAQIYDRLDDVRRSLVRESEDVMLLRKMRGPCAVLFFFLLGCGNSADTDQLFKARQRLHPAACENTPAVTAVAGVNADPHMAYIGDWVVVSVCHLRQVMDAADAAQAPITLFVEGLDTGNEPLGVDLESGTLTFALDRNEKNRLLWRPFLYDPLFDPEVSMRISVGIRGGRPLPRTAGANLTIHVRKFYVDWTTWIWLALLVVFTTVLILTAVYTDMLRDGPRVNGVRQPFSLGRSQMACWFFLVLLSYVFLWLVTGDRDTIPPSLLGLMGISSATALIASAIPSLRPGEKEKPVPVSKGWWRDLVADERGVVALDRLQIVVWTIVLSGVFLTSVIWDLTMPEFNSTLLALMGISSGTYLGFKLPPKT